MDQNGSSLHKACVFGFSIMFFMLRYSRYGDCMLGYSLRCPTVVCRECTYSRMVRWDKYQELW
eukprot:4557095-Ditylum_brightwellii.AAC.1